jgi:hypothetical protein
MIRRLARLYDDHLFGGVLLSDLRAVPRLAIAATNLNDVALTVFSQGGVEHVPLDRFRSPVHIEAALTTASLAVAASSAFPAFFPPVFVTPDDIGADEGTPAMWLTDGGVTDNLAIKAVDHAVATQNLQILVSDAGRSFEPATNREFNFVRTALRSTDLMMYGLREIELLRARSRSHVNVVSISDAVEIGGAAPLAVQQQLESIRTDLDAFSPIEVRELRRHGFWCARKALDIGASSVAVSNDFGAVPSSSAAKVLRKGRHRRILRAGFSVSDWISYLNSAVAIALIAGAILVAPWVRDRVLRGYNEIVRAAVPVYRERPVPSTQVVERLQRSPNNGFQVQREDRVWDLRRLRASADGAHLAVVGPAIMTRTITLSRDDTRASTYRFWFETSGREFTAWTLNDKYPLTLRTQEQLVVNGQSLLKPWDLGLDVSQEPLHRPFQLMVQSRTEDAFRTNDNWWIGMAVVSSMGAASMRIIFPPDLPFREPAFLKYPSGSAASAVSFDGTALTALREQELLWTVERPVAGFTYRVNWHW